MNPNDKINLNVLIQDIDYGSLSGEGVYYRHKLAQFIANQLNFRMVSETESDFPRIYINDEDYLLMRPLEIQCKTEDGINRFIVILKAKMTVSEILDEIIRGLHFYRLISSLHILTLPGVSVETE
jgi:hypothetical protein